MGYEAKIIADSISPIGARLTTMHITFPRIVLAEFNTHRMFSRNSASSRAIPTAKMIQKVMDDPFIPIYWGKNQKGMQADEELPEAEQEAAEETWLSARDAAVYRINQLLALGIHKQIANRLLEPWLWHTVIVTATDWDNFFNLRCHKDAQPEIRKIAEMMRDLYLATTVVRVVNYGEWHLPFIDKEDTITDQDELARVSSARCARVSYLTHEGKRDIGEDMQLADRLQKAGHMSPFEHAATPSTQSRFGNFRGWIQYRKHLPNEDIFKP